MSSDPLLVRADKASALLMQMQLGQAHVHIRIPFMPFIKPHTYHQVLMTLVVETQASIKDARSAYVGGSRSAVSFEMLISMVERELGCNI